MLTNLQKSLKYTFNNPNLLNQAIIHSSYYSDSAKPNNERLEFLGDRVLAICIADILYNKFLNIQEDKLSSMSSYLTSQQVLNNIAIKINLHNILQHNSNINSKILSSALEALLGAIYLDSNLKAVKVCINILWEDEINNISKDNAYDNFNPKSYLQNWVQKQLLPLPIYVDVKKEGTEHEPTFVVELQIKNFKKIIGYGSNKQLAQKHAALQFINLYVNNNIK